MEIVVDLRGMGFVVRLRRFGGMKITGRILSEFLKAVCSFILNE
jgi:hypothetical protein